MPDFYERFKAELDTETIMADTPAVVVVGMCLRAAQRAQMALDLLGELRTEDLRVDIFRHPTTFPGPSVVRLTHLPTGIVVTSDEHSSTLQAKAQAVEMLRERLLHNDGSDA